ncbi:zinc ribbon domain-containing protein [Sulfobacillus thermosulfidooxidans]
MQNFSKKGLSIRIHQCPTCGLEIDGDVNAAINILHRGLAMFQPLS